MVKGEAIVSADPPKAKPEVTSQQPVSGEKDDAVTQQEVSEAKSEVVEQQQSAKIEVKAVEKAGQPKSEDQPQSLLSFAGIKGALGFGPSKPERPPPVSQGDDMAQIEEDEEADINAAIHLIVAGTY